MIADLPFMLSLSKHGSLFFSNLLGGNQDLGPAGRDEMEPSIKFPEKPSSIPSPRSKPMNAGRQLISEMRIPGGHARAFEVGQGQFLTILDVEGQQVADFFAFHRHHPEEKLSPSHTRTSLLSLKIQVGDKLRSSLRNPMFEIIEDTAQSHDLLIAACDERRYLVDYGVQNHRSCVANVEEVLQPYGIPRSQFPEPFNIFQSTRIEPDGRLIQQPCPTKPGDYITLQALMDVIAAVSACPMDLNPIGGNKITDILVRIQEEP